MLTAFKAEIAINGPLIGIDHTTQAPVVVQPGIVIMQVCYHLCIIYFSLQLFSTLLIIYSLSLFIDNRSIRQKLLQKCQLMMSRH